MTNPPTQMRQGDVFLMPVAQLPEHCTARAPSADQRLILAHGEATGHAHSVAVAAVSATARAPRRPSAHMWIAPDGEWYLEVIQTSLLHHEEHTALAVPPGIYHLPVQVEADPDDGVPWLVAD